MQQRIIQSFRRHASNFSFYTNFFISFFYLTQPEPPPFINHDESNLKAGYLALCLLPPTATLGLVFSSTCLKTRKQKKKLV